MEELGTKAEARPLCSMVPGLESRLMRDRLWWVNFYPGASVATGDLRRLMIVVAVPIARRGRQLAGI